MKILLTGALALVLHLLLGWAWTLAAGVFVGNWVVRKGWLYGAVGVGLEWLALILYSYVVAATPVQSTLDTLGGLVGNLPGLAIVGLTLLIGLLLGALGGAIGTQLGMLMRRS